MVAMQSTCALPDIFTQYTRFLVLKWRYELLHVCHQVFYLVYYDMLLNHVVWIMRSMWHAVFGDARGQPVKAPKLRLRPSVRSAAQEEILLCRTPAHVSCSCYSLDQ